MLGGAVIRFEQALIEDTIKGRLEWHYMDEFTDDFFKNYKNDRTPAPFDGMIESEFFRLDYHRAYACMTNAGIVYLYLGNVYPGSEDPPSHQLYLALHPMPYDPDSYVSLGTPSENLYQLENAIRDQMSKEEPTDFRETESFIELYLRSRSD